MEVTAIDVPIGGMFGWGGATYLRVHPASTIWEEEAASEGMVVAVVVQATRISSQTMHLTTFGVSTKVELLIT